MIRLCQPAASRLTRILRPLLIGFVILGMAGVGLLPAAAGQAVRVGMYRFPPFVDFSSSGTPVGLSVELVKAFNALQDALVFEPVITTPGNRYADFTAGRFDMMFFESPDWGWRQRAFPVIQTRVFLTGGERYVALQKKGRTQAFFDDLSGKSIAGIHGYHYGFADFKDDAAYLRREHGAKLVRTSEELMRLVLSEHADLGVVTESFLNIYLRHHSHVGQHLLVSDRYDQIYRHRILIRQGFTPGVKEMEALLAQMSENGSLKRLFLPYQTVE